MCMHSLITILGLFQGNRSTTKMNNLALVAWLELQFIRTWTLHLLETILESLLNRSTFTLHRTLNTTTTINCFLVPAIFSNLTLAGASMVISNGTSPCFSSNDISPHIFFLASRTSGLLLNVDRVHVTFWFSDVNDGHTPSPSSSSVQYSFALLFDEQYSISNALFGFSTLIDKWYSGSSAPSACNHYNIIQFSRYQIERNCIPGELMLKLCTVMLETEYFGSWGWNVKQRESPIMKRIRIRMARIPVVQSKQRRQVEWCFCRKRTRLEQKL